jgi:hypothetical protein
VIPRRIARIAETSWCSSRERISGVTGSVVKTARHAVTSADAVIRTTIRPQYCHMLEEFSHTSVPKENCGYINGFQKRGNHHCVDNHGNAVEEKTP